MRQLQRLSLAGLPLSLVWFPVRPGLLLPADGRTARAGRRGAPDAAGVRRGCGAMTLSLESPRLAPERRPFSRRPVMADAREVFPFVGIVRKICNLAPSDSGAPFVGG